MGRIGKKLKGKNLNMFGNPIHHPTKEYKEGWNRIFGKKKEEEDKETEKFLDDLANNTPNIDQFEEKKETKKFPPKNSWGFTKK